MQGEVWQMTEGTARVLYKNINQGAVRMKKMFFVLGAAAFVYTGAMCVAECLAEPAQVTPEMQALIAQPMKLQHTANEKRHVTLSHTAHQQYDCVFCHHKPVGDNAFVSCAVQGCHDNLDRKDKSERGYYQAVHKRDSEKSCVGCHRKLAQSSEEFKEKFKGCAPCHPRPEKKN
ncbi:MAG TPA: cytochrome c3 family protein [Candidatus Avidesulfovibrio excrementigallinarum]|nr:cytochrome c3 family protein [Candidatus Avidesulfovibrio excrementigallinarum]